MTCRALTPIRGVANYVCYGVISATDSHNCKMEGMAILSCFRVLTVAISHISSSTRSHEETFVPFGVSPMGWRAETRSLLRER